MRRFRVQFTLRGLMIVMIFAAIWSLIIAKAIVYQNRYFGKQSVWDRRE